MSGALNRTVPPDRLAAALLAHFDRHRRPLPWRETTDPYAIWVSEVMLQQTRVETAIPYFERWLERFPTVRALADAGLDDVLQVWQGLGYYARGRNLHRAARLVRERHGGQVPDSIAELRALPGVGEYTAGAVASIAFGAAVPAVDGNVRRVLARLHDLETPSQARLRDLAAALVPARRPGDFNQAIMELGATVCTPRAPACDACPLAPWCRARALGVQEARPRPRRRAAVPHTVVRPAVLLRPGGWVLLTRRPDDGLLGGLWEFPDPEAATDAVAALVQAARPLRALDPVVHEFSHLRVTYRPTLLAVPETNAAAAERASPGPSPEPTAWASLADLADLDRFAMPVAQRKIARAARLAVGDPPTQVSSESRLHPDGSGDILGAGVGSAARG